MAVEEAALQSVVDAMMMEQGSANVIRQKARNIIKAYRSALAAPSPDLPKGEVETEIADAVLSWLVKHDLADAGNEYTASDVIEILNDLAPASEDALREAYILGRKGWCPASILEDQERTERDWQKARNRLTTLPTSPSPIDKGEVK